jgi:glycosyltransferase involved in cell wall biosynthesis
VKHPESEAVTATGKRKLDLLLIGPLPPPVGGATRVFSYLTEDLERDPRVRLQIINISPGSFRDSRMRSLLLAARTTFSVLRRGPGVDLISYHAGFRGRVWFGPVLFLISRILRKPLIMRAFGGAFAEQYARLRPWHQWLLRKSYFRSELCLLQTKSMVDFFRTLPARRVEWFSNYTRSPRGGPRKGREDDEVCRRLVFLGHVKRTKGVEILLEAEPALLPEISIDIYGPLLGSYRGEEINRRGGGRIRYAGVLTPSEVMARLWDYDALVLPTFHSGEGYPGVILEAYSHGMPVIASRWMGIPEIVDPSSGILIEPKSPRAFSEAANQLCSDRELFRRLRRGAETKAREFSDEFWTRKFVGWCSELSEGRGNRRRG